MATKMFVAAPGTGKVMLSDGKGVTVENGCFFADDKFTSELLAAGHSVGLALVQVTQAQYNALGTNFAPNTAYSIVG